ncbi:MAG: prolyl oligopeptidase family serine peptidase [Phycisphaerae bacterium]|nr:prolyl oligopeptidase family serine peptidase [Phycisphaerae bacterium]
MMIKKMLFVAVFVIPVVMALTGAAQAKLIAYYDFEGDTQDAKQIARLATNHGTNHGVDFSNDVPSRISGHSTNSGHFNGVDAWVDLGDLGIYDKAHSGGASFSLWIKAASHSGWIIAEGSDTSPQTAYVFGAHSGLSTTGVAGFIRDASGAKVADTSAATVLDSQWHHMAWTDQGGVTTMYIDGVLDATDFNYSLDSLTIDKTSLGAWWKAGIPLYFLNGLMDDVAVWDHVLSQSEVDQLANGIPPVLVIESDNPDSGLTDGVRITKTIRYQSTISSDANEPLELVAELNYKSGYKNAPIAVVMHGYSPATGNLDNVRASARRLRDSGFFAISVAMRGRDGSDGVRDSGGLEIYDIYDAVEYVKLEYAEFVDPNNVHITGYSGGGGNTMSALTKFPDYFRAGAAFFGMSDYGYDPINGWYFNGASSGHQALMRADIGDPTQGIPDVEDKYAARASNLASKNNPYSEIHLFVNQNETTCPMINDITYLDNAIASASFDGEFDNITVHIGGLGEYEDFNLNGIYEANELQSWPHGDPIANVQHAAEAWYLDRVLTGQIPQPVLNPSDELYVAGYVKTKPFSLWLGNGDNAAAQLNYNLASDRKEFVINILTNNKAIESIITVDTSDMEGSVFAKVNDTIVAELDGGDLFTYNNLMDGDKLELYTIQAGLVTDTRIFSPISAFVSTCAQMGYKGRIKTYDADRSAAEA